MTEVELTQLGEVIAAAVAKAIEQREKSAPAVELEGEFVDIAGAAKILRLAKPTIYSNVCRGEIPAHKVGRRLLFKVSDLRGIIKTKTN